MRNLGELNINEEGVPVKRPPPSAEEVAAFEKRFSIKLPEMYLSLLNHANGGHPEADSIEPVGGLGAGSQWAVDTFFFLSNDRETDGSLWREMEIWGPILGKAALPFARDACDNVFFIDMSSASGSIKVCIHDEDFRVRDMAVSFEDFIDRLFVDPEDI